MKFAFVKVLLNPEKPIKAIGYAQQTEPMFTVRDNLEGRLFLFLQEGELYALCTLDLLYATRELQHTIEDRVSELLGMPAHVVLACSHTHFAPNVHNTEYAALLADHLVSAITGAAFREADLTCGFVTEPFTGVGLSRISHWNTDQILAHALCFYEGGKRIASIILYNCHPTVLNGYTPFFTAEYPGAMRRALEAEYPDEFFAFLQGAAGDVSTRFTRSEQTEAEMEKMGLRMADEAKRLLDKVHPSGALSLACTDRLLPLTHQLKDFSKLTVPEYYSIRERETLVYGIEVARKNLADPSRLKKDARISALKFGPFSLVFSEFELFSEFNTALDPEKSGLVCYSQGGAAYIAGPSFDGMTYETLHDTLDDASRSALMSALGAAAREF